MLGLDEAGVGPGFGNLVACALHIPDNVDVQGLTDSKKMSDKQRRIKFEDITKKCFFGIGKVTNEEIDNGGLGEARKLVFERALENFQSKYPDFYMEKLIIDGTIFRSWKNIPYECIVKADLKVACVSAASIIAKVTRDNQIIKLCKDFPYLDTNYGLLKNKGYLVKTHISGIVKHGKTKYHRHSYNLKLSE